MHSLNLKVLEVKWCYYLIAFYWQKLRLQYQSVLGQHLPWGQAIQWSLCWWSPQGPVPVQGWGEPETHYSVKTLYYVKDELIFILFW